MLGCLWWMQLLLDNELQEFKQEFARDNVCTIQLLGGLNSLDCIFFRPNLDDQDERLRMNSFTWYKISGNDFPMLFLYQCTN